MSPTSGPADTCQCMHRRGAHWNGGAAGTRCSVNECECEEYRAIHAKPKSGDMCMCAHVADDHHAEGGPIRGCDRCLCVEFRPDRTEPVITTYPACSNAYCKHMWSDHDEFGTCRRYECSCQQYERVVSETTGPGKLPREDTHAVRVVNQRTGKIELVGDSVMIENPCGDCSHGWAKHVHDGEQMPDGWPTEHSNPKCSPHIVAGKLAQFRSCACGGYTPKYAWLPKSREESGV